MPSLYIENFEAGLDTRKSAFTAPPGSLRVLSNAHITRGKEIEQRKAFATAYTLPSSTVGLHAAQDTLYTFGSSATPAGMPVGVTYQRLQAPDGATMTDLVASENFNGKVYAIAEFADGDVYHFYNGARVTDWDVIAEGVGSNAAVAVRLGNKLDASGTVDAAVNGTDVTLTGLTPGQAFTVSVTGNLSVSTLQTAQSATTGEKAKAAFTVSWSTSPTGVAPHSYTGVLVDGVDILGATVDYAAGDAAGTATAIANQINANLANNGYSASASSATVTVTAPSNGSAYNGNVLEVTTTGDAVASPTSTTFSGGLDDTAARPQISRVRVTGTFAVGNKYTVTLNGTAYSVTGLSAGTAMALRAVKQKMYVVTQSLLYFSGFAGNPPQPDPTQWDENITGAGFINLSTQYGGSEELIGLGVYQGRVAAFSRRSVQIWDVDADPALNTPYQVLLNIGSIAPRSIVEYGDLDIFFLSESGVRSLRARDSSNLAAANDVGVAIDAELVAYMRTLSRRTVRHATAIVEPTDSRYLLAIGERVYVFSNFPGSGVAAWSTYDMGGEVSNWAVVESRLYARVGNKVCLYGGLSGEEYDAAAEVVLPFLDAENPAGLKQMQGLDVGAEGAWTVDMALEPSSPDVWERIASLTTGSYGSLGRIGMAGQSTHVALRLRSTGNGPARLGNVLIHYNDLRSD